MASAQPPRARGRGRPGTNPSGPAAPSITSSTDILESTTLTTTDSSSLSVTPTTDISTSTAPTATDSSRLDTGFSSASSTNQPSTTSSTTPATGRGRGDRLKRTAAPSDPYWAVTKLTEEEFKTNSRPTKPDELGTIGQQTQVIANYFPISKFPHKGLVYQYHVQIRNRKNLEIHRDRRRVLYNTWLTGFCRRYPQIDRHKIVFDNQHTILSYDQQLPDINENAITEIIIGPNKSNRQEEHTLTVQAVGKPVDLSLLQNLTNLYATGNASNDTLEDLEHIKQVLSIALHEHCSSHADFIYNRSFFSPTPEGQHGEWDLGTHQLLMNLDVRHTVFMKKQPFLEFLCEVMLHSPSGKKRYGRQRNMQKVEGDDALQFLDTSNRYYRADADFLLKNCKHLRVRSQDANKPIIYEIKKLGEAASVQTFELKGKTKRVITVAAYYKETYSVDLKYPTLPTLEMRNGSYLPMELVDVEPARMKKITDEQRDIVCRQSTMKPPDYYKSIQQIRHNPKQQFFEKDPFVNAWKLNVDVELITIPARILPMPEIFYTDQYRVIPAQLRERGTWELMPTRFYKPTDFPAVWAMINLSSLNQKACEEFYYELSYVAKGRGITFPPPQISEECDAQRNSTEHIVDLLKNMMNRIADCKFFLVILPGDTAIRKQAYISLKKQCELELGFGIATQMIQEKNAVIGTKRDRTKWDHAKLNNILLKINTKLNGTNSILKVHDVIERFFSRGHRIMYVGADLSHSAPGSSSGISSVAVVASADDVPNRYFKEVYKQERPQEARKESRELIVHMRKIMKSLIHQYEQHRGYPPNAIVVYRDGISSSEVDLVFEKELTSIREACADLSPVYRPYLTYIVVNKRHHTRFFPTDSDKNVKAGTVVDSHDITNATTYDFYLNSHHGALGTSRPTHYHVLYDDNKLKPDEVQMLTNALCYTSARCTRAVSIPAPVKYADLLALRASFYINMNDQSDTESVASGSHIAINQENDIRNTILSERVVLSSNLAPDCPYFL